MRLPGPFQEAGRIVERGPVEEADVGVRAEGVHIGEGRLADAGRGMAVVQAFAHVGPAAAQALEPGLREPPHLVVGGGKPGFHSGIAPDGALQEK